MASQYTKVKKFAGVYYSESKVNLFRGRPDRTYWINFRDFATKKLQWKQCGKASEGWTPEAAQKFRIEQVEKDRAGLYKSSSKQKEDSITLHEFMQEYYLPWSQQHQKRPFDDLSRYSNWLEKELGPVPLNQITKEGIEKIILKMQEAGRAPATQKHLVKLIRHLFNKAAELNLWSGDDPCQFIQLPKVQNARLRFLSREETHDLLAELRKTSKQTAQIATLSLYSGMRLGEVLAIKWRDIDLGHGIITILDSKNGESRPIFITLPIKNVLEELAKGEPEQHLFVTSRDDAVKALSSTFGRVVKRMNLNQGVDDRRQRVSFHTLRHTYASWAVMAGVPLYQVGKALGHKSTIMTERYSHLAPDSQRMTFEAVANYSTKAK